MPNVSPDTRSHRRTKIIFTVGPATESPETLRQLIDAGVDVCRINMAHASHSWTRDILGRIREACQASGRQIATLMDIKGPEIRTGPLDTPYQLEKDEVFDLTVEEQAPPGEFRQVEVNYPYLVEDVKPGDPVLVDNGLIRFEVLEALDDRLRCRVVIPGPLGSRRHINLPGVRVRLPSLTRKDREDLRIAIEEDITFIALSFVREPDDVDILKRYLSDRGSRARVIAKVEDQQAISNLDHIIQASDGLMVARGDLGIECPYEILPIIQHRAVKTCINLGKPVIVATHMLESMVENPVPTRAEVSDVAQAVIELADCVMLSAETTTGKYPLECVAVMKRIAAKMEETHPGEPNREIVLKSPKGKMLRSAAYLAQELGYVGIVIFTKGGYLARRLSSLRPKSPIFAFTDDENVFRGLLMEWGIEPFLIDFDADPETTIETAFHYLLRRNWVRPGDLLIVITNVLARDKIIDSTQIRTIEG